MAGSSTSRTGCGAHSETAGTDLPVEVAEGAIDELGYDMLSGSPAEHPVFVVHDADVPVAADPVIDSVIDSAIANAIDSGADDPETVPE